MKVGRKKQHIWAIGSLGVLLLATAVVADTFPPDWPADDCATPGAPCHYAPVAWPADDGDGLLDNGDWVPYTIIGSAIEDNGVQDPSNGGTSPQNYVNLSSGCTDLSLPSLFIYYDLPNQVIMFRMRIEQIGHTYATGPTVQPAGAVDPWKSALWTMLIDIDGDGFRDYAVQLAGDSGTPGEDIDRLVVYYSDSLDQSLDADDRDDICVVSHSSTGFTDGPADFNSGNLMNFHETVMPDHAWPNGSNETLWDYGTTRARELDQGTCVEYFVDFQIPLAAFDASGLNPTDCGTDAPVVTEVTPICILNSTSNSLNNPLQKDVTMEGPDTPGDTCILDPNEPAPFGDCFAPGDFGGGSLGTIDQPTVRSIGASGCNLATLSAVVSDALDPQSCYSSGTQDSTITSVQFYYYQDTNGNGVDDDSNAWTAGPTATETSIGLWETGGGDWDSTALRQGNFLIGVRAEDDQGNITLSFFDTDVAADAFESGAVANPSSPGELFSNFNNSCGTYPTITKVGQDVSTGLPSPAGTSVETSVGSDVDFTLTVTAATDQALTLDQLDDFLPTGWTYDSEQGGDTLTPTTTPAFGASGTISWTFAPAVSIPAGTSATLIFRVTAPGSQATFNNTADAQSSNEGTLSSNAVELAVGAPRLTIAKDADVLSQTPGNPINYTITYSNDSPVSVTNTVITDVLPVGLDDTTLTVNNGGTYDSGTRTITWTIGALAAGSGPFSVSYVVSVENPYPSGGAIPLANTASIDSDETTPATDDASVYINLPLRTQKSSSTLVTNPSGTVTWTVDFANTGNATATGATLVDTMPAGFTYIAASSTLNGFGVGDPGIAGQVLTWVVNGNGDVAGSVTAGNTGILTFQTTTPAVPTSSTAINSVDFSATGLSTVSDDYTIGVTGSGCTPPTTYYLRDLSADVGFAGTQLTATSTAGSQTSPGTASTPILLVSGSGLTELERFYTDPAVSPGGVFTGDITSTLYVEKDNGNKADFTLEIFDYDPTTGTETSLGSDTLSSNGGGGVLEGTWTITPSAALPDGHRLLYVISAINTSGGGKDVTVNVRYDAAVGEAAGNARSDVCLSAYTSTINKQVDNLSVTPSSNPPGLATLNFTIFFTNIIITPTTHYILY